MGKERITTKSLGRDFVDIPQEFVLEETARTKTVFKKSTDIFNIMLPMMKEAGVLQNEEAHS